MSAAPRGFSLETFEALCAHLAGLPVRLVLCQDSRVVLPDADRLDAPGRACVAAYLAGARPAGTRVCTAVDLVAGADTVFRLVAIASVPRGEPCAAVASRLAAGLAWIVPFAEHALTLCAELDEMTGELTSRYEELDLIYHLDKSRSGDDECLRKMLTDAAEHLEASALAAFSPDDGLRLVVVPDGDDGGAPARMIECAGEPLRALVHLHGDAVVLNRPDDERLDASLRDTGVKIVAAPMDSCRGVVVALRAAGSEDFLSTDRKLLTVVAERIAATLRGGRDDLTGLLNRSGFEQRLDAQLAAPGSRDGVVLYVDLRNFRVLNETCGRLAGDELLRQLAEILGASTRDADAVARLGGDEFAVLVGRCAPADVATLAESIITRVSRHDFVWAGKVEPFAVNVGAVPLARSDGDAQRVLSLAESACDLAAEAGPNRHHVYSDEDERIFEKRGQVQWVPRIRDALHDGRFELHTQIIMPLADVPRRRVHHEVLLRMRDDDGRLVFPGSFLPAAERFRLMPEIDRWVATRALEMLCDEQWRDGACEAVWSINLSGQSLSDERFHDFLLAELAQRGFPYRNLCFEVTETEAVANHRAAVALISRLRALGTSFALDDFGSGMSSFAYLKSLPVDLLKIDGSFVRNLATDPFSRATVDAVNRVGKVMGLATVAEYVEDEAIIGVLRELGVDYGQGYGLGRPQPMADALAALTGASGEAKARTPVLRLVRGDASGG